MGLVSADDTFLTEWNASILGPQGVSDQFAYLADFTCIACFSFCASCFFGLFCSFCFFPLVLPVLSILLVSLFPLALLIFLVFVVTGRCLYNMRESHTYYDMSISSSRLIVFCFFHSSFHARLFNSSPSSYLFYFFSLAHFGRRIERN